MKEFKFACPGCGQHIKCGAEQGGTEMVCPTCFRKLVVPQPPKDPNGKFILTAAEVQARPATSVNGSAGGLDGAAARRSFPLATAFLAILLVAAGAGAYAFREKLFRQTAAPSRPHKAEAIAVAPTVAPDKEWTLSATEAHIPETPVKGRVHGSEFQLDRATITAGTLNLRQGPKWPPDLGVTVYLHAEQAEQLAGKDVLVEPTLDRCPKITLRWKDENDQAVNREVRRGYLLKVEFGQPAEGHLPGKIYLATPDEASSHVAGTFRAEIRRPKPKAP